MGDAMLDKHPCMCIGEGVFEITEFGGVSLFLIEGSEKALLIDTGVGIGNLALWVGSLTNKPVDVLLTHNHRDHVGGAPRFSRVHMSRADHGMGSIIRPWTSRESRLAFAKRNCVDHSFGFFWSEDDIVSFEKEPEIVEIEDGWTIDLGNRKVSCWLCPGHTPGSVVAIDEKTGILFCGDACNGVLGISVRDIPGVRRVSIEEARDALARIDSMKFNHQKIFNGHTDCRPFGQPLPSTILPSLLDGLTKIMEGNYVLRKEWIPNLGISTETAVFGDVSIQFRENCIFSKGERK